MPRTVHIPASSVAGGNVAELTTALLRPPGAAGTVLIQPETASANH
jgi:hypothetical protein